MTEEDILKNMYRPGMNLKKIDYDNFDIANTPVEDLITKFEGLSSKLPKSKNGTTI
jgi:hypothetical protein